MRGLDPRIHDEARIQNSCDIHDEAQIQNFGHGASMMRRKFKTLATLIACGASWIAGSSPAMTVERLMVQPGLQARRRRFALFCPAMTVERLVVRPCPMSFYDFARASCAA